MRALLETRFRGADLDAATLMLTGAVINSALLHGQIPEDEIIVAAVDVILRA